MTESQRLLPRALLEPTDATTFRTEPVGTYVSGTNWFYFAIDPKLYGYALWGRPDHDDIRALVRVLEIEIEIERPLHAAIVDLAGLDGVMQETFGELATYTVKYEKDLARIVSHTAIVRPPGMTGAIVTGFFDVASRPFPVSFWDTAEAALTHLGCAKAGDYAKAMAEVQAHISNEPLFVRELRTHLATSLAAPSLDETARALGLSRRTLQRRLTEHRTSFETELQHVRLGVAESLLRDTETPVTTIAIELGFASTQYFATLFRKRTGLTPTEFRRLARPHT